MFMMLWRTFEIFLFMSCVELELEGYLNETDVFSP